MIPFDRLKSGVETRSADETMGLAAEVERLLPNEAIITLNGDLGTGKTTFIKGLATAVGIEEVVTSPTFNIFNTYHGRKTLLHMDAYRLEGNPKIIDELMLEDFMIPPYRLAIEWPGNMGEIPWPVTIALEFSVLSSGNHRIRLIPRH